MSVLVHDARPLEVLIADDHDLFALGLEETLAHCPDMTVVGRASTEPKRSRWPRRSGLTSYSWT